MPLAIVIGGQRSLYELWMDKGGTEAKWLLVRSMEEGRGKEGRGEKRERGEKGTGGDGGGGRDGNNKREERGGY
ncbi:BHLH domain-containing protein [Psidium guajava]|nr:BHLH domain-containing protein [Psidium guajava]